MGVSLNQVSKILNMSRAEVMDLVTAGKLKAERKGKGLTVDEPDLWAFLSRFKPETEAALSGRPRQVSLPEMMAGPMAERISVLEKTLAEKADLLAENKRLELELHKARIDIADRDAEIEKLKGETTARKAFLEKEAEDRLQELNEERARMEREVSERAARERKELGTVLQAERLLWSERLENERSRFEAELDQLQTKGGFWTRFIRMLTWS
jgi:regulator of replication initiation timing